jgi:hypothetical protein
MSHPFRIAALLTLLLLASAASESALARNGGRGGHAGGRHHGGHRAAIGLILAAPAYWYFRSPIYAPPIATAPIAPPVYVEQGDAQPASGQSAGEWWYYCAESRAYYPDVKECASAWQPVAAQLPASR